jgi:hypothetical protein
MGLRFVLVPFYTIGEGESLMMINTDTIARAITDAPAWALVGLTAPRDTLREDAAREVAQHLYAALYRPVEVNARQLHLPL